MKLYICLVVFITLAKANIEIIQDRIIPKLPKFERLSSTSRIIGGSPTEPHSKPYQVAMAVTFDGDDYFCSGTLISTKFVLTAAHCIFGASNATVYMGVYNILIEEESQVTRPVKDTNFRIHEKFDLDTITNDIATMEFDEPVVLDKFIQLVELPRYFEVWRKFAGKTATISGWGLVSDTDYDYLPVLREVDVKVITNLYCYFKWKDYKDFVTISSSHICTSGKGNVGACNGDSGGPLVIGNKQIGIISFGLVGYCESGLPTGFTRITSFLKWIESNSDVKISK